MWPFRKTITLAQSGILKGMTDCHSHLLPGVDDGVETLDESLRILDTMEKQGIRKVWLTPHIMEDIPNETATLQGKFQELKRSYNGMMELALAAEYMMDNLFEERLEKDDLLPLEEGKRYLLVETSYFNPPMRLLSVLQRIQKKGYYPLLAHPERYEYMQMKDYKTLKEEHIFFQLNLPSLAGMYGRHVQEKAEALLKAGMYEMKGNDIHSLDAFITACKHKICYLDK
ncbi:tyrosine-protein phosphatase [Parabacteroides merdae]|uniref:tyrosine-protein phosphatase n=1 Tax=Parabacteroides merdae TaxID=46503 RepID=UPI0034A45DDD